MHGNLCQHFSILHNKRFIWPVSQTPFEGQQKVLSYGIGTAAVLRAVMILLGVEIINVSLSDRWALEYFMYNILRVWVITPSYPLTLVS